MPSFRLMAETNTGVSAANVVATMDVPATNQPSDRPATKKSLVPRLALRVNQAPIPIAEATYKPTIVQSIHVIGWHHTPLIALCCTLRNEMPTIRFTNRLDRHVECLQDSVEQCKSDEREKKGTRRYFASWFTSR